MPAHKSFISIRRRIVGCKPPPDPETRAANVRALTMIREGIRPGGSQQSRAALVNPAGPSDALPPDPHLDGSVPMRPAEPFEDAPQWVDIPPENDDTRLTLREKLSAYRRHISLQQRQEHWDRQMSVLLPLYSQMKQCTENWTNSETYKNFKRTRCKCPADARRSRYVDLIDILGQSRRRIEFCGCMADSETLMLLGFLGSTLQRPQTAFSFPFLRLHAHLWNTCAVSTGPYPEGWRFCWEEQSGRLTCKNSPKPRSLRRPLRMAIDMFHHLKTQAAEPLEKVADLTPAECPANRACPACFGPPSLLNHDSANGAHAPASYHDCPVSEPVSRRDHRSAGTSSVNPVQALVSSHTPPALPRQDDNRQAKTRQILAARFPARKEREPARPTKELSPALKLMLLKRKAVSGDPRKKDRDVPPASRWHGTLALCVPGDNQAQDWTWEQQRRTVSERRAVWFDKKTVTGKVFDLTIEIFRSQLNGNSLSCLPSGLQLVVFRSDPQSPVVITDDCSKAWGEVVQEGEEVLLALRKPSSDCEQQGS